MKNILTTLAKRVTLELVYEAVEERTKEIKDNVRDLHVEMGQLRQEMGQLRQEVKSDIAQLRQEISHINTRFDQLFSAILNLYEKSAKDK